MRRLISVFLVACAQKTPPAIHHEPAAVASAPSASATTSASASVAMEAPPAPAGCRHAIPSGTDIAHVSDAALRDLVLGDKPGPKKARDCVGGTVDYETPIPPHVDRVVADANHLAVFVELAKELGYSDRCPGFAAIVRLDHDELVTEGVGAEQLDDCDQNQKDIRLAILDGHRALLFPHVTGTGENGDFGMAWSVSIADEHGALKTVGAITSTLSMGNGSMTSGKWFDSLDAKVLDAGSLQIEEHWQLVREDPDAGEVHGRKRTVIRTYALDGGKLVRQ